MSAFGILRREIKAYFLNESIYKQQLVGWIVADTVKITALIFVWMNVAQTRVDIDTSYVASYYVLVMLIQKITSDFTIENGVREMINGKFSNLIIKPFNYLIEYVGRDLGNNILRFMLFIPIFIIGVFILSANNLWIYEFNFLRLIFFVFSLIIAFIINFLLGNIFSLPALRIKEMDGIRIFYYNTASMLSGEFIPIVFLPSFGQYILKILPFRYTLSFPAEILLGEVDMIGGLHGFVISIVWVGILYLVYKVTFSHFIRYYEAEGI